MLWHILNIFISWNRIWLNSTKTRLLWAISRSPLSWNWDVLTGRKVILWWWKHIFHRRFSNLSNHTNIHLNNLYKYYFVCVVQGGRRPSALHWPATTASILSFSHLLTLSPLISCCISRRDHSRRTLGFYSKQSNVHHCLSSWEMNTEVLLNRVLLANQ